MFCHKCGNQPIEGSAFCQKCGEKLIAGELEHQVQEVPSSNIAEESIKPLPQETSVKPEHQDSTYTSDASTQQPSNAPASAFGADNGKKKSKKLPIILGAAALVLVVIITIVAFALSGSDTPALAPSEGSISLSQTYTNEAEGISFKYPSGWIPVGVVEIAVYYTESDLENSVVFLANEVEDAPELNSYIEVLKYQSNQADIDHLFVSDEEFKATFDDDVSITETSVIELSGIPTRMITYVTSDDIVYRSYFYGVGLNLYRINLLRMKEKTGNLVPFFDAIIDSYTITSNTSNPATVPASSGGANTDTIAMYDFSGVNSPYAQHNVPDYASFISDGQAVSTEDTCLISLEGDDHYFAAEYSYHTGVGSSEEDRDNVERYSQYLATLGYEVDEYTVGPYGYGAYYFADDYTIVVSTSISPEGTVSVYIVASSDEGGEGDYAEEDYDSESNAAGFFDRLKYINGPTYGNLLRYPDDCVNANVFFEQFIVTSIPEDGIYIARNNAVFGNKGEFIVVRGVTGTGPNVLKGDLLTVYGRFQGITNVNFEDGRTEQVPFIDADRFIVDNVMMPEDLADFARGMVSSLDYMPDTKGYHQYISGATIKFVCNKSYGWIIKGLPDANNIIHIDGYSTSINWVLPDDLKEKVKEIPERYKDEAGSIVYITGTIIKITRPYKDIEPRMLTIDIQMEAIEPYYK